MNPREQDFEHLLRGHATLTLTAQERARLAQATASDRARRAEVAALDHVHAAFARERSLRAVVSAPVEAVEESDDGFARLAAAGARCELDLRGKLLHTPRSGVSRPLIFRPLLFSTRARAARVGLGVVAALAAGLLLAIWLGAFSAPPALHKGTPGREVAGGDGHSIVIAPRLSAVDRSLSWSPLWHATSYEVVVVDARGNVVLQRSPDQARSTRWELTTEEFEQLRAGQPELRLRVRALDGVGLSVGTSGDLPLSIK